MRRMMRWRRSKRTGRRTSASIHVETAASAVQARAKPSVPRPEWRVHRVLIPRGLDGGQFFRGCLWLYLRAGYQHYGEHDDRTAQQDESVHVLMQDEPSQEHGHDGVHVSISRNF